MGRTWRSPFAPDRFGPAAVGGRTRRLRKRPSVVVKPKTARDPYASPQSATRTLHLLRAFWQSAVQHKLRFLLGVRAMRAAKAGETRAVIALKPLPELLTRLQVQFFHASEDSKLALGIETDVQWVLNNHLIPAVTHPEFDVSEFFPDLPEDGPASTVDGPDSKALH